MATPEIRRGDFIYHDTLFVDVGNNHRHPRASVTELRDYLMPKKSGPGTGPAKDQVAHWYEAQLVHYGLPRVKDKNAAKVRLTNAVSAKTLKVPEYVVTIEESMKKEYAAALRKGKRGGGEETPAKGKKRKADDVEAAAPGKMSVVWSKDGEMRFEAERFSTPGGSASKKTKATPKPKTETKSKPEPKLTKNTTTTPKPKAATKPPSASAARSQATTARQTAVSASPSQSAPASRAKWPKQTARRGNNFVYPSCSTRPAPASSSPARAVPASNATRPKQTARKSQPFPYPSSSTRPTQQSPQETYDHTPSSFNNHQLYDSSDDDPPPPYSSVPYSNARSPSPPRQRGDMVQIAGTYSISVSTPSSRPLAPRTLSLAIDHATSSLWGTFHIGPKRGLIRMDDISGLPSGATKTFGWRSEDENSNNKMRFGRGCDGEVAFDGNGGVQGVFGGGMMYGEDMEFWGSLEDQDDRPDVEGVREEWDGFPRRAYGRG